MSAESDLGLARFFGGDGGRARFVTLVDEWVENTLKPAAIDDEAPDAPQAILELLAGAGLLEHTAPDPASEDPGIGLQAICAIRERLAYASALADTMFIMQGLGSHPVVLQGSGEMRANLLSGVRCGAAVAAIAITEPGAGSDLGSIATTARRDGDDYVLDGEKVFISNAGIATFYSLLARTGSPEEGKDGLTFFLVEADRSGLRVEPQHMLSAHPIGRVVLDGCRVPAVNRLGDEGGGFALAVKTLTFFRPSVGAAAVGFAARALDEARGRSRERKQFGRKLSGFQGVQHMLADMATGTAAARLLVERAAEAQESGESSPELASMAKLFATENAGRVVDLALQIHGASGLVAGSIMERLYRDVRALRIYEGTSEIQRTLIAKEILRR